MSLFENKEGTRCALNRVQAFRVRLQGLRHPGRVPEELSAGLTYRIGRAYAALFHPKTVVVGRDMRLTSSDLSKALIAGLTDGGCNALDIGICGTEMMYYARPISTWTAALW